MLEALGALQIANRVVLAGRVNSNLAGGTFSGSLQQAG